MANELNALATSATGHKDKTERHACQARRARRRPDTAAILLPLAPPQASGPGPATLAPARPRPAERRWWAQASGPCLARRLRGPLRRRVPPRPAPRRHPLPRRPPALPQRRPRPRPPPHPHPGAASSRGVLLHRGDAPAVPGREGGAARQVQGHREPARHGHVADSACPVHRAQRGAVRGRGGQQRGGVRAVRRRGVRLALPRGLLARLRPRLPRRRRLPSRRGPAHQVGGVLELSQRRRTTVWHGGDELDDDVLLRVHAVPGEPGEIAQVAAGGRGEGRCSSSVIFLPRIGQDI